MSYKYAELCRTWMVCPVVSMSFSGLHSVVEIFTNGNWMGGCMNRVSWFWVLLKYLLVSSVKCLVCLE
jgi:hypothetical protein